MKLLLLSQYYPPETGACANRISGFARYLARCGHDITVLTGFPNYPKGKLFAGYRQRVWKKDQDGKVALWRCWTPTLFPKSPYHRFLNYFGFFISSLAAALLKLKKPDVVMATSGPILVGFAGALTAKFFKCPFVLDLRDVWPERVVAAGEFTNGFAIRILNAIEAYIYRKADRIICVSDEMKMKLERRNIPSNKVTVITNGTDLELFRTATQKPVAVAIPENAFVLVYAGTMGLFQDHELLLDAAERLLAAPQIQFLLIGEGVKKQYLHEAIETRKLSNLHLIENQSRENLAAILACCHAGINANTAIAHNQMAIPVKMLDYMACGLPVILANEGETEKIIHQSGAGFCIPPGQAEQFTEKVLYLFHHPEACEAFGKAGKRYVEKNFSIETLSRNLEKLLLDLAPAAVLSSQN